MDLVFIVGLGLEILYHWLGYEFGEDENFCFESERFENIGHDGNILQVELDSDKF